MDIVKRQKHLVSIVLWPVAFAGTEAAAHGDRERASPSREGSTFGEPRPHMCFWPCDASGHFSATSSGPCMLVNEFSTLHVGYRVLALTQMHE